MARPKNPRNILLHAIEKSGQPLYLLDSENTLAYLNSAAAAWLGANADELVGLRCLPSAVPLEDPLLNRLRGLIPDSGQNTPDLGSALGPPSETVSEAEVFALLADGSPSRRRAVVLKLAAADFPATGGSDSGPVTLVHLLPLDTTRTSSALPALQEQVSGELTQELHKLIVELSALLPALRDLPGLVGKHPLTWRLRKQLEAACLAPANLLLIGLEQSLPESFAKAVCNATADRTATLPVVLNARLADEEQLLETMAGLARRLATEKNVASTLLVVRAEQLPPPLQPLLRQWLQQHGTQVRTVSTSHASLLELAATGSYDFELAVRLSTQEIRLPRLAERLSDLPAIAAHWLEHYQAARSAPAIKLSAAAIDQLLEFEWTGDLEQLRSVLLQAAAQLPEGGYLLPEHFPEIIRFGIQARRVGRPPQLAINLDQYLEEIERLLLERALQQANQNKAQAARLLGITRQRFLRRCEHLQLSLPEEPIDFRPADDEGDEGDSPGPVPREEER